MIKNSEIFERVSDWMMKTMKTLNENSRGLDETIY
jgi:hypothetical protein